MAPISPSLLTIPATAPSKVAWSQIPQCQQGVRRPLLDRQVGEHGPEVRSDPAGHNKFVDLGVHSGSRRAS
jgi:hypothetical protein